jgi:hypothetical protein
MRTACIIGTLMIKTVRTSETSIYYENTRRILGDYCLQAEGVLDRKIIEPKRDKVTDGLTEIRNEKLHNLYSSSHIIKINEVEFGRAYRTHKGDKNVIHNFGGKT